MNGAPTSGTRLMLGSGSDRACAAPERSACSSPPRAACPRRRRPLSGTVPNQLAVHARLERAELVRRADEHGIHRAHAAANRVRRLELHQHAAHEHADHVAGAGDGQHASDSQKLVDNANTTVATPNAATPPNIQRPACRWMGRRPSMNATMAAPTAGRGAQEPEARGCRRAGSCPRTPACSATAPPNNTANRSSEIAPSTGFLCHTNLKPSSTWCQCHSDAGLRAHRAHARHEVQRDDEQQRARTP